MSRKNLNAGVARPRTSLALDDEHVAGLQGWAARIVELIREDRKAAQRGS